MKIKKLFLLHTVLFLSLTACSPPFLATTQLGDVTYVPQLNVLEGRLERIPAGTEYSLYDGTIWDPCKGTSMAVDFQTGNRVWIRPSEDASNEHFLGEIEALSGRPDLVAGDRLYIGIDSGSTWSDVPHGAPGDSRDLFFFFFNFGDSSGYSAAHKIRLYLSTDPEITPADTLMKEISCNWSCPIGEVYGGLESFTVPSVSPGIYYIGIIVDATNVIPELSEGAAASPGANATQPDEVVEFRVIESAISTSGAFKIVNSWGVDPPGPDNWENKPDGHYWMTCTTMKKQKLPVFYYNNDFSHVYEPTILTVFKLTHPRRDECQVTLGLGDPTAPVAAKAFMAHWGDEVHSGALPFPGNSLAMDISEFASLINDYDLFLTVENTGQTICSIESFKVEFYSDYDSPPFKTISGDTGRVAGGTTGVAFCPTKGVLNLSQLLQIRPLSRAVGQAGALHEEKPSVAELEADMVRVGVYQEGKNYNKILYGRYGTGFQPPSREAWGAMSKLRWVDSGLSAGVFDNTSVDYSATQYFPPIGNQSSEGSCTCFSLGYYIGTYMEAKEHGWDLSSVSWDIDTGAPDSELDKILSPDFLYHQINRGVDEGSPSTEVATLLIQLGCATWQEMPYDTDDSTSWPSEAAFREAPRYRGRHVGNNYWATGYTEYGGYFIVEDDADIGLLLGLLEAGYCVSMTIDALETYTRLDANDVVSSDEEFTTELNHAQTVVGFKDGTAWNPSNPDM